MNVLSMSGISSPKFINTKGGTSVVVQHQKLQQDWYNLLKTERGTLLGNPEFGSDLHTYLFQPATIALGDSIKREVQRVIEDNYTSIRITNIDVALKEDYVYITVTYGLVNSEYGTSIDLVFERRAIQ